MNFSPAAHQVAPARLEQESRPAQADSAAFKTVFRPPALTSTYVVTDPFVRVSPRLRNLGTYSRDITL